MASLPPVRCLVAAQISERVFVNHSPTYFVLTFFVCRDILRTLRAALARRVRDVGYISLIAFLDDICHSLAVTVPQPPRPSSLTMNRPERWTHSVG